MRILFLMLLLFLQASAVPYDEIESPLHQETWFADTAKILKSDSMRVLDLEIDDLEQKNGTQLTVVTVENTSGVLPKTYATSLFNKWGVGRKNVNNGVLILLVIEARRVEIEVGDGANRYLSDSDCQQILNHQVVPEFKKGDYNGGIVKAVRAVIQRLENVEYNAAPVTYEPSSSEGSASQTQQPPSHLLAPQDRGDFDRNGIPPWALGGMGASLLGGMVWIRRHFRNKPRICKGCQIPMSRLDEMGDDQHLSDGQRTEERLGSVDYDVWVCQACDGKNIIAYAKWFGSFSNCGSCGYKALETSTTTLRSATTSSEGQGRRDENCRHCRYSNTSYYSIARLPEPRDDSSSSSSSSSSGFGGGSSSGGGAGASW